ncbi:MAG: hypothetical protein WDO71_01750 [Bacteroidota bacterium]
MDTASTSVAGTTHHKKSVTGNPDGHFDEQHILHEFKTLSAITTGVKRFYSS